MKKLLIFLFLCVPLIASAQISRISPSLSSYGFLKDSSYVSFDLDTLYLANDSIYITASGDTLLLVSDTTYISGVLRVDGNTILEPLATSSTTVLTPTSTGLVDTLETTDLATADITVTGDWTFGTINADSINVDTLVAVNIYCDSVYTTKSTAWADYVFEDAYQLQDFSEKMQFVKEFHYLPALGNKSNIVNLANRIEGVVKELEESYLYIEKLERRISELEKAD